MGFPEHKYYVGVAQPWRFKVVDSGLVIPESPWEQAATVFPAVDLELLTLEIEKSLAPLATATVVSPLATPVMTPFLSPIATPEATSASVPSVAGPP